MTKDVNPWELIHDKTISQLVFAYEAVLTEMRTHAKADRTIKEWVKRLDFERDEFVQSMRVKPDEPTADPTPLERAFAKEPERSIVDKALRQIGPITWNCTVCGTKNTASPCEHVRLL